MSSEQPRRGECVQLNQADMAKWPSAVFGPWCWPSLCAVCTGVAGDVCAFCRLTCRDGAPGSCAGRAVDALCFHGLRVQDAAGCVCNCACAHKGESCTASAGLPGLVLRLVLRLQRLPVLLGSRAARWAAGGGRQDAVRAIQPALT